MAQSAYEPPLALEAKDRWPIPNSPRKELSPMHLGAALDLIQSTHPHLTAVTISATYNCVGMVLAARRTWVDTAEIERVFQHDGYREIEEIDTQLGDVVTYHYQVGGPVRHIGIVAQKKVVSTEIGDSCRVLSKWGEGGEYLHDLNDVPMVYGRTQRFWTHRRDV